MVCGDGSTFELVPACRRAEHHKARRLTNDNQGDYVNEVLPDILACIGNTPLVALRNVVPENGSRILLKLESENPTGSMKDRMALAMLQAAEADGRLEPGGSVVEYTGGSTGVSLALVCAVKGYRLNIVTSDAFAREKLDHMRHLGATLHIVPSDAGRMTEKLTRDMIEAAHVIAARTDGFWTDQLNNNDQIEGYRTMGAEIWRQTGGRIDGFVQSVGTAGCISGVAAALRDHGDGVEIVAVEPAESPVLSGGRTGAHRIDGIGAGFVVPLWRKGIAEHVDQVSTEDAMAMVERLAREEGLFAGTSTGVNVIAALRLAERLGPAATVVTVLCDTGMKYLSKQP
jgi:cysteine synthase